MRRILQLFALCCGFFMSQHGFSYAQDETGWYNNQQACAPMEYKTGDCYCLVCKYEPCYYKDWKCEWVDKSWKVNKCRYVPKTYSKKCIRYVPEVYYEQCCKYVPEHYCETVCEKCPHWCCETKCKMVLKYYYKHVCEETPCCNNPCQ